jgi:hypothetical protein
MIFILVKNRRTSPKPAIPGGLFVWGCLRARRFAPSKIVKNYRGSLGLRPRPIARPATTERGGPRSAGEGARPWDGLGNRPWGRVRGRKTRPSASEKIKFIQGCDGVSRLRRVRGGGCARLCRFPKVPFCHNCSSVARRSPLYLPTYGHGASYRVFG